MKVTEGDPVVLQARRGSVAVRVKLSSAILPGQVFLPRGYDGAPANALADPSGAAVRVRVQALAPVAGGTDAAGSGVAP